MTESHTAESHGGTNVQAYLVIFGALVVFTIISFVVNVAERHGHIAATTGFAIILAVAVCKAALVATFFMHLLFDWKRFYFIIIPVMVLGTMLVIVLLPDIVLAWHHGPSEQKIQTRHEF